MSLDKIEESPEYKAVKEYYQSCHIDERTAANAAWQDVYAARHREGRLLNGNSVLPHVAELMQLARDTANIEVEQREAQRLENRNSSNWIDPDEAYNF